MRPYTAAEVSSKTKEETTNAGAMASGSDVANEGESDTSFSDAQENEETLDETINGLTDFSDWITDLGTEVTDCKFPPKPKEVKEVKEDTPVAFTTTTTTTTTTTPPPVTVTTEISTAEDCRLEVSVEMKAERELRRLAFTSRQRFLTGMDIKSGWVNSAVVSAVVVSAGDGVPDPIEISDAKEWNFEDCSHVRSFVSRCVGKLVVDAFDGFYDTESVLELCLSLNDEPSRPPLFLVTRKAMEASLAGLESVQGASSRLWNIAINWLRTLVQQGGYTTSCNLTTEHEDDPFATISMLVENPRFSRVIGNLLSTYNCGDSGQKVLGPSVVESFSLLLKELVAAVSTSSLQEFLLDTFLDLIHHK